MPRDKQYTFFIKHKGKVLKIAPLNLDCKDLKYLIKNTKDAKK